MTNKHEYDKKKLIILRAALILAGGVFGGLLLWQYFVHYPDIVRSEFRIVITVVSAVFFAAIFGLSAKPVYRLISAVAQSVKGVVKRLGGKGVAAVVLGVMFACALVVVIDLVMSIVQNLWAVRLLVDVLVFIVLVALFCYVFIKVLSVPAEQSERAERPREKGYLLSAECLTDARSEIAAKAFINVAVAESAFKALCVLVRDAEAVERLDKLVKSGDVKLVKCRARFDTLEQYVMAEKTLAQTKRLKYVTTGADGDVRLDVFAAPAVAVEAEAPTPESDEK